MGSTKAALCHYGLIKPYASTFSVTRKWQQWQRNEAILASLEAENDLGQVFNLLDLAKRGVSNLVNRRNELMTRIAGLEGYAKEQGHTAVFYTMTVPSKYHAYHSKPCRPTPKYNNATPAETHAYFNKIWARIRAAFKHEEIKLYGIRVGDITGDLELDNLIALRDTYREVMKLSGLSVTELGNLATKNLTSFN